jgi:excisionase family DNA binding protein
MTQEILTTKEAMEYLRITRPTFFKLIKEGKLKASKVGHNYRIRKIDLDNFLEGETDEPKAATR